MSPIKCYFIFSDLCIYFTNHLLESIHAHPLGLNKGRGRSQSRTHFRKLFFISHLTPNKHLWAFDIFYDRLRLGRFKLFGSCPGVGLRSNLMSMTS